MTQWAIVELSAIAHDVEVQVFDDGFEARKAFITQACLLMRAYVRSASLKTSTAQTQML